MSGVAKFVAKFAAVFIAKFSPIPCRPVCCAARLLTLIVVGLWLGGTCRGLRAQEAPQDPCPRPAPGSAVPEPEDLRSQNGVLKVDLTVRNYAEKDGSVRFCYLLADGNQSPTLRLAPGDLLILNLKNDLSPVETSAVASAGTSTGTPALTSPDLRNAKRDNFHAFSRAWKFGKGF